MIIDSHHHFWDRSLSQFDYSWQENAELKKMYADAMLGVKVLQEALEKKL